MTYKKEAVPVFAAPPLPQHSVDETKKHKDVAFVKLLHSRDSLLDEFWILRSCIEKFLGSNAQVLTNGEKFFHGRKRFPRGNIVDVASAVAQIVAHLIFRYAFLDTQLGYPFTNKIFIHCFHPFIT